MEQEYHTARSRAELVVPSDGHGWTPPHARRALQRDVAPWNRSATQHEAELHRRCLQMGMVGPHCTHDEHCEEMLHHAAGVPRSTTQSCIAMNALP